MSRAKKSTEKTTEKKNVNTAKVAEIKPETAETSAKAEDVTTTENAAKADTSAKSENDAKAEISAKSEKAKATTTEAKKTEAKKTETKKTTKTGNVSKAAEKTTKAAPTEKIVLQVDGRQDLSMDTLIDKVKAAYVAEGHKADSIKNIEVYIKLSENMAYYVIDGYASGISLS